MAFIKKLIATLAPIQDGGKPVYVAYGKYYVVEKGVVTPFSSGLSEQKYMLQGKLRTINPIQYFQETSYTDSMDDQILQLLLVNRLKRVGRTEPNEEDLKYINSELKKRRG
jgi:hypothetical protein